MSSFTQRDQFCDWEQSIFDQPCLRCGAAPTVHRVRVPETWCEPRVLDLRVSFFCAAHAPDADAAYARAIKGQPAAA